MMMKANVSICLPPPPKKKKKTKTLHSLLKVVPILRAGLVLLENSATLLPASETYHLGLVRDEETLQVSESE